MEHSLWSRMAALLLYVGICAALVVLFAGRNKIAPGDARPGIAAAGAAAAIAPASFGDAQSDLKLSVDALSPPTVAVIARKTALESQRAPSPATVAH